MNEHSFCPNTNSWYTVKDYNSGTGRRKRYTEQNSWLPEKIMNSGCAYLWTFGKFPWQSTL